MTTWIFREPGVIPGVPGQFANCRVTVHEDGTTDILPLEQPPHDAPTADIPATASEDKTKKPSEPEQVAEAEQ